MVCALERVLSEHDAFFYSISERYDGRLLSRKWLHTQVILIVLLTKDRKPAKKP